MTIEVSYAVYEPSSRVERYHHHTFETDTDYAKSLGYSAIPILAVGVAFLIIFIFWSCGRCCGCCKPKHDMRPVWKILLTGLLAMGVIGCLVLVILGFHEDQEQSNAMRQFPGTLEYVASWITDAEDKIADILEELVSLSDTVQYLDETDYGNYISDPTILDILDQVQNMNTSSINIREITDKVNISKFRAKADEYTDTADHYRHLAIVVMLSVLLSVIVIQIIVSLLNGHGPKNCHPEKRCCAIGAVLTIIFIILMVLIWLLASLFFVLTSGTADFCYEPTSIVLDLSGNSSELAYYLTCEKEDNGTSYFLENPTSQYTVQITAAFGDARNAVASANSSIPPCAGNSVCIATVNALNNVSQVLDDMEYLIGEDTNHDGHYDTGLFSLIACPAINARYQSMLILVCDEFYIPLSRFFELLLAFAALMTFVEILKRLLPDRNHDESKIYDSEKMEMDNYQYGKV